MRHVCSQTSCTRGLHAPHPVTPSDTAACSPLLGEEEGAAQQSDLLKLSFKSPLDQNRQLSSWLKDNQKQTQQATRAEHEGRQWSWESTAHQDRREETQWGSVAGESVGNYESVSLLLIGKPVFTLQGLTTLTSALIRLVT